MERFICVHGHFYQPPRENPWLEAIELQDSAFPFHDWNARVTDECYGANSTSRIMDDQKRITGIVNNYSRISFNFGPTLLTWLQSNAAGVYEAVLQADRESRKRFSGHGSALAQVYNHVIMPLTNHRDRRTQVFWGIRDFVHRFGRDPEGMWLSETAVDLDSLDILAEMGIKFTILAQHQAGGIRRIGTSEWEDVSGGRIDPTRAYQITLPSGRKMALFFYDGPISRAVAFEGLLENGENFARRIMSGFSDQRQWPQLVHIATDGESYGHHHRYGDMALAYALHSLEADSTVKLTNYGEYLSMHPPAYEVQIVENSSWSCVHGVERWWKNCGCNSGGHPGWDQEWRTPLRKSLDWLRDTVSVKYEERARELFNDPWKTRDDYIEVIQDHSLKNVQAFLNRHCIIRPGEKEIVRCLKLLELQRHTMLMYTSCGWFFDELSGIETVQIIQYAGRVVQLAEELFGDTTEGEFLKRLQAAGSNLKEFKNGAVIYERFVKTAMIDLTKVAAHYAISSLFEDYSGPQKVNCYDIDLQEYRKAECGKARLGLGRIEVVSEITRERQTVSFSVLHFGDHNLNAGVRLYRGDAAFNSMIGEISGKFSNGEFPEVIRLMDKHFGVSNYSLKSLFRDEQRKVVDRILLSTLTDIETEFRKIYQNNYPLMRFLSDLGSFIPRALRSSARLILNSDLRSVLTAESPDREVIEKILSDVEQWKVGLGSDLGHVFRQSVEKKMGELSDDPENGLLLAQAIDLVDLSLSLPFNVELREVQNAYYSMLKNIYPAIKERAGQGEKSSIEWDRQFVKLGQTLTIKVG
ncbi:MAG: DUF3536 domain-containing protein [Dehalococcoidales bacterium]|nr:DUF3536 domain-containing protein [Dehalococcoidales bacterium]